MLRNNWSHKFRSQVLSLLRLPYECLLVLLFVPGARIFQPPLSTSHYQQIEIGRMSLPELLPKDLVATFLPKKRILDTIIEKKCSINTFHFQTDAFSTLTLNNNFLPKVNRLRVTKKNPIIIKPIKTGNGEVMK